MRKRDAGRFRSQLEEQLAALVGQGERAVQEMVDGGSRRCRIRTIERRSRKAGTGRLLRDRDRKLISKIQEALARIDAGTFGRCTACGRPIGAARLRARPVTDLCIDCKTEAERIER